MRSVVIIDDEPTTRMDIGAMLEELDFQIVGEGGDGFDALEVCRKNLPDVVLLDVKMPVFDGLNAAEEILKQELAKCIVQLTAFDDRETIERAKRAGVTGYLVKPVEQRMLLPTIEVALEQSDRLRKSREETTPSAGGKPACTAGADGSGPEGGPYGVTGVSKAAPLVYG